MLLCINSQLHKPRTDGGPSENIYSAEESSESNQLSESSNFSRNDTYSTTNGSEGDNQSVEPEVGHSLLYRWAYSLMPSASHVFYDHQIPNQFCDLIIWYLPTLLPCFELCIAHAIDSNPVPYSWTLNFDRYQLVSVVTVTIIILQGQVGLDGQAIQTIAKVVADTQSLIDLVFPNSWHAYGKHEKTWLARCY